MTMPTPNPLADAAIARVEESLKGKPVGPKSLTGGTVEDILAVCLLVKEPDPIVKAIIFGVSVNSPTAEVFLDTDHLRHALKCAKG